MLSNYWIYWHLFGCTHWSIYNVLLIKSDIFLLRRQTVIKSKICDILSISKCIGNGISICTCFWLFMVCSGQSKIELKLDQYNGNYWWTLVCIVQLLNILVSYDNDHSGIWRYHSLKLHWGIILCGYNVYSFNYICLLIEHYWDDFKWDVVQWSDN